MRDQIDIIADFLYTAYCNHTGFKSAVTGADLPKWSEIKIQGVKDAWLATAKALYGNQEICETLQNNT